MELQQGTLLGRWFHFLPCRYRPLCCWACSAAAASAAAALGPGALPVQICFPAVSTGDLAPGSRHRRPRRSRWRSAAPAWHLAWAPPHIPVSPSTPAAQVVLHSRPYVSWSKQQQLSSESGIGHVSNSLRHDTLNNSGITASAIGSLLMLGHHNLMSFVELQC